MKEHIQGNIKKSMIQYIYKHRSGYRRDESEQLNTIALEQKGDETGQKTLRNRLGMCYQKENKMMDFRIKKNTCRKREDYYAKKDRKMQLKEREHM